jgi:hypothetical protein
MAEHVLRGQLQVLPRDEGGRHLAVFDSPTELYRIPLAPSEQERIARELAMSDEDLAKELARRQAAKSLVVPENGRIPVT